MPRQPKLARAAVPPCHRADRHRRHYGHAVLAVLFDQAQYGAVPSADAGRAG